LGLFGILENKITKLMDKSEANDYFNKPPGGSLGV
jgi:hypothetical protein